ncbi:MAG: protein kinase domain-containing protein [Planctomycetaceae bacterium]
MRQLAVGEFLELLRHSNLLSPEQWVALRHDVLAPVVAQRLAAGVADPKQTPQPGLQPPPDLTAAQLADKLVEWTWLTRWQADTLIAGHKTFYLGKYRLLERVGTGGMGAVYKARHERLGRVVALKIMSGSVMRDARAIARFRNEIRAAAALDHPHIVSAYDADYVGNVHFLVMEFVPGHDLGWFVLRYGQLPIGWSCECIRQAALGLQHAHEQGMVHRDIKPTNLLVADDPETGGPMVKLLDLGLARFASDLDPEAAAMAPRSHHDASLTQAGQVLGTPDYMSPEQSLETRFADARSDIFSLGCTLFRLLAGDLPYAGETIAEKLKSRQHGAPRRLRDLRPEVSAPLEAVVAKMMAREPGDRFQSAADVVAALTPFTTPESCILAAPAPSLPAPAPAPSVRGARSPDASRLEQFLDHLATHPAEEMTLRGRQPFFRQLTARITPRLWLGATAAALAIAVCWGLWYWLTEATLIVSLPAIEQSDTKLFVNQAPYPLIGIGELRIRGRPGRWVLQVKRPGYAPIEHEVTLKAGEYQSWSPIWTPTAKTQRRARLAALESRAAQLSSAPPHESPQTALRNDVLTCFRHWPGTEEGIAAARLLARMPAPLDALSLPEFAESASALPSGPALEHAPPQLVGILGDARLKFWNRVVTLAANHDGTLIAGAAADGAVKVFDRGTGRTRCVLRPATDPRGLLFNPTGDALAVWDSGKSVTLWNAATGAPAGTLEQAAPPVAFSADGARLATAGALHDLIVWEVGQGRASRIWSGAGPAPARSIAFRPDGKELASEAGNAVLLWNLASQKPRLSIAHARQPRFNHDGSLLATTEANRDVCLRNSETGDITRKLPRAGDLLAFSTDGNRLVTRVEGKCCLWNTIDGSLTQTIPGAADPLALSPDANRLALADATTKTLRLLELTLARETTVPAGAVSAITFTADGTLVVTGSADGCVRLWNAADGREQTPADPPFGPVAFGPDGALLAAARRGRLENIDLSGSRRALPLEGDAADIEELAISPDGMRLAGCGRQGASQVPLRWWDFASGRELPPADDDAGRCRTLAFSADGRQLATLGDMSCVTLWNPADCRVVDTWCNLGENLQTLAFDPQGRWLAVAGLNGLVRLRESSYRSRVFDLPKDHAVRQLAFSPQGMRLAAVSTAGVYVCDTAGAGSRRLLSIPASAKPTCAAFNLVGDRLAVAGDSGTIWIWHLAAGTPPSERPAEELPLSPGASLIHKIAWSPHGRHLLTHNGNGTIFVLRLNRRTAT